MAEVLIPPWVLPVSPETVTLLDDATTVFQPAFARGLPQVQIWADPRWQIKRKYRGMRGDERAALRGAINEARGKGVIVRASVHQPLRGSFPATELLTNNTFANGTTGYNPTTDVSLSVSDRVLRLTRIAVTGPAGYANVQPSITTNAPYVWRVFVSANKGQLPWATFSTSAALGAFSPQLSANGMCVAALVPFVASQILYLDNAKASGTIAGEYFDVSWCSLSRCALVDGGLNLLLYSDQFDNAIWTKNGATVTANGAAAPDGTTTMDALVENSANAQHYVLQGVTRASMIEDLCAYVVATRGAGTRDIQLYLDDGAGNGGIVIFNLGAGTITSTAVIGTGTNVRAFIKDMGGSRYFCWVIARCPASTSARMLVYLINSGLSTYTGDGVSQVYLWRGGLARSTMPTMGAQTLGTAVIGTSPTGSAMYVKGLPVSTNGLLLTDDFFEINGELKQCTAALNSDAAGLGYLQFRPGLAGAPVENDPVIINSPMGRFRLMTQFQYDNQFGLYMDADVELTEVYG